MTDPSTEGKRRCGSCLQWVGTAYDGEQRPYRVWLGDDGHEHVSCADRDACERRWSRNLETERFAAAEARVYDPEPEDEDDEEVTP